MAKGESAAGSFKRCHGGVLKIRPSVKILLIGDREEAAKYLKAQSFDPERFDYLNCLGDMPYTESDTKRSASLFKGLEVLQRSEMKSFVTYGNTVKLCENIDLLK